LPILPIADLSRFPVLAALGELQWYERVREIRTEWAHFSSIFLGEGSDGEPVIVLRAYL